MNRSSFPNRTGASLATACVLVAVTALAQAKTPGIAPSDRQQLTAHFERIPEAKLKTVYLHCDREARQRLLDLDEAFVCSLAGEVLKMRSFSGDFNALLGWWRQHRDDRIDEADERGDSTETAERQRP